MSGGSARSMRNFSLELWQDLVLHGIRKTTFQHLTVNWNVNVLGMALKTLRFVKDLSRTLLSFVPRCLTTRSRKLKIRSSENLKSLIIEFCFLQHILENMLVRYRGQNNKGVLDRPWTKRKVLRAISNTLKFQFLEIVKIEDLTIR